MSTLGAVAGLSIAILLIFKKLSPVYSLITGAFLGGIIGGAGAAETVAAMTSGVGDVVPAVIRILAAGVLTGVLIETGAADVISNSIVDRLGPRHLLPAIALATMLLTATGVFVDVAVITVAPIALNLAARMKIAPSALLVMMIGGGKCGNIISPNPNTIIAAGNFGADLYSTMVCNVGAALAGLLFTVYVIGPLLAKGALTNDCIPAARTPGAPRFAAAIAGPLIAVGLLALRPLAGITVDPLIALPAGGMAGLLFMRKHSKLMRSLAVGLSKMAPIALLLIATGTIAGIIKSSTLTTQILSALNYLNLNQALLAPVSGALLAAATASTTAGAAVASSSFSSAITAAGVAPDWGAAMVNAGSTVADHLPHGSFFHATGGAAELSVKQRLRLIPYESLTGLVLAAASTISYLFFA